MCGEKTYRWAVGARDYGSPPRMRGKGAEEIIVIQVTGITPACAGKSPRSVKSHISDTDHPRMCGEKGPAGRIRRGRAGSPPHVRGKAGAGEDGQRKRGITPACAGKSRWVFHHCILTLGSPPRMRGKVSGAVRRGAAVGITPRTCGEKRCGKPLVDFFRGSPQHVQGKVFLVILQHLHGGITPAYAGKRARYTPRCSRSRDHPRMCGEKAPV